MIVLPGAASWLTLRASRLLPGSSADPLRIDSHHEAAFGDFKAARLEFAMADLQGALETRSSSGGPPEGYPLREDSCWTIWRLPAEHKLLKVPARFFSPRSGIEEAVLDADGLRKVRETRIVRIDPSIQPEHMRPRTVHKLQDRIFDPAPHTLVETLVYDNQIRRRVAWAVEVPIPRSGGSSMQDVTSHPVASFARRINALELLCVDSLVRFGAHRVAGAVRERARLHPSALTQRSWEEGDYSVGQIGASTLASPGLVFGLRLLAWHRVDRWKGSSSGNHPWTRTRGGTGGTSRGVRSWRWMLVA
jgi:hypothetical protein